MKSLFFWKVFAISVVVVAFSALLTEARLSGVVEERQLQVVRERVREDAIWLGEAARDAFGNWAQAPEERRPEAARELQALADRGASALPGRRITFLAADGTVLGDSSEDSAVMENHGGRPEMLQPGTVHRRFSKTLQREMMYSAQRVAADEILLGYARVARAGEDIAAEVSSVRRAIRVGSVGAVVVALLLAALLTRQVTRPLRRVSTMLGAIGRGVYRERLPVTGRDEIAQLTGAVNDLAQQLEDRIARLEQARQQDRAILTSMEEGVVVVDRDKHVVLVNDAARRLLDMSGSDPVGRPLWEVTRSPDVVQSVTDCLERNGSIHAEVRTENAERTLVLDLSAVPLSSGTGGCVTVLHDLTEVRRLETIRRDFVANVSHELKTPLTAVSGYVEAIMDEPDMETAVRRSFVKKAKDNADRLAALIADLLILARIEAQPELADTGAEPVDLGRVVEEAVDEHRASAERKGVALRIESFPEGLFVLGHVTALVTAVGNLVDNAVKYSRTGGAVGVSLRREGDEAWIAVRDEGPGIPAHELERIFERFYRVDKDRSRALGGTGLGLSIVKHAVASHGGEVTVESQIGVGSDFRVRLPLDAEAGTPRPQGTPAAPA